MGAEITSQMKNKVFDRVKSGLSSTLDRFLLSKQSLKGMWTGGRARDSCRRHKKSSVGPFSSRGGLYTPVEGLKLMFSVLLL